MDSIFLYCHINDHCVRFFWNLSSCFLMSLDPAIQTLDWRKELPILSAYGVTLYEPSARDLPPLVDALSAPDAVASASTDPLTTALSGHSSNGSCAIVGRGLVLRTPSRRPSASWASFTFASSIQDSPERSGT